MADVVVLGYNIYHTPTETSAGESLKYVFNQMSYRV